MDRIEDRTGEERSRESEASEPETYSGECEVCGCGMYELHCKIICPNCGYRRDCSDP